MIAGHYTNAGASTINAHEHINRKHLEIRDAGGAKLDTSCARSPSSSSTPRTCLWRDIGAKVYPLSRVNDALADAEAMRLPKAIVDPRQ